MLYYEWSSDAVRWFYAASEYTGFHRALAQLCLPHLTRGGSLADLGCGLGLIDLELAGQMSRVTCIDQNPLPLQELEREAKRRGVDNLEVLQADCRELTGVWDDVLTTFYGKGDDLPDLLLPRCRHQVAAVIRADGAGALSPDKSNRHSLLDETEQALRRRGAVYRTQQGTLEYGQPLESRADAAAFVRARCHHVPDCDIEKFLDAHLTPLDHPRWPWYLPNRKEFTLFLLPREGNEHLLPRENEV